MTEISSIVVVAKYERKRQKAQACYSVAPTTYNRPPYSNYGKHLPELFTIIYIIFDIFYDFPSENLNFPSENYIIIFIHLQYIRRLCKGVLVRKKRLF